MSKTFTGRSVTVSEKVGGELLVEGDRELLVGLMQQFIAERQLALQRLAERRAEEKEKGSIGSVTP